MRADGVRQCKDSSLADCTNDNGQLRYQNCLYIPAFDELRLRLLQGHHDPQQWATQAVPRPTTFYAANTFGLGCDKTSSVTSGIVTPASGPRARAMSPMAFSSLCLSPTARGKTSPWTSLLGSPYLTVTMPSDLLTKQRHLVPCSTVDAEELATLLSAKSFACMVCLAPSSLITVPVRFPIWEAPLLVPVHRRPPQHCPSPDGWADRAHECHDGTIPPSLR